MSSICLTDGALTATLFAQALHLAWTPADGVPREATYWVEPDRIVLVAERVAQSPALPAPPEPSALIGGWHHGWPQRAPQQRLLLERTTLKADYVLCGQGWCRPLEQLLPRARAAKVELFPCALAERGARR